MSKHKPTESQKRPRKGVNLNLWLPKKIAEALEAFRQAQPVPPNKTDIGVVAIREFLERQGYLQAGSERGSGEQKT